MTTFLSYFNIVVAVALIVFLFTGYDSKRERDFQVMTGLMMLAVVTGALVSLSYLGALG